MSDMEYKRLSDCATWGKDRTCDINYESYISTENMIKDKGGVTIASSLPDSKTASAYSPNDILLSNIRPYFRKIWYADKNGSCSNDVLVVRADEDIDSKFLYYVLSDNNFFNYDTVTSKGTKMPRGTQTAIMKYLVPDINVGKQRKIADILSAYDNLIENNNKRIRLLEQMAENLYKEWFVRFRFPGYEHIKFIDDIPSDWQILRMSNFCYVTDGTHDTPKPVTEGGVPLVTGKCIKNGFIDFNEPYNISYQDHESISKRSGLQTGDILFSNIGTVGTTCIVNYDREFSVKNVIIFKPDNTKISNYLYSWLNSDSIQAIFATQTNGASQQFVGLNFMRRFKILVPNENVLTLYSDRIKSIRAEIVKLHDINNLNFPHQ